MVLRVTGHRLVPSRMIYNNIISKKHIHYPQLLGTSYKFSEIISLKKFAIFMIKGKQVTSTKLIKTEHTNSEIMSTGILIENLICFYT